MTRYYRAKLRIITYLLGAASACGFVAHAQTDSDKLEQENQDLRRRLDALEDQLKKEGLTPSGDVTTMPVKALSQTTISGFVTASYFYDLASKSDMHPVGYLWNTAMNQFTLNKVKLTLASPAVDKDKWDAAYRLSLLWGQDATVDNSSSGKLVGYDAIREAYVELNVPVGTGLNVRAGELISLLNYESGDGGAANYNFSQGYQWWYTGNGPAGGIQLGYDFNDVIGVKARLQNGLYTGEQDSGSKTFLGGLYINPDKKTSLAFLGFSGRQDIGPGWYLDGGSFIGSRQLTETYNLTFATELDYFHFSGFNPAANGLPGGANHGDFESAGAWLQADFCPTLGAALRGDIIVDDSGFGTFWNSPNPAALEYAGAGGFPATIYTSGAGQDLSSVTLTLDWKPVPSIKIQPEIRWNHSTFNGAFAGKSDQVIVGAGASYLF